MWGARHDGAQCGTGGGDAWGSHSRDTLDIEEGCVRLFWAGVPTSHRATRVPVPQPVVGKGIQGDAHTLGVRGVGTSSPSCIPPHKISMCDRIMHNKYIYKDMGIYTYN